MPGFFGIYSFPKSEIVDARKGVTLGWYYYYESGDYPLSHYVVRVKLASATWANTTATYKVMHPTGRIVIPPYTLQADQFYTWDVTAWVINQETGVLEPQGSNTNMMDTSGYTRENNNILSAGDFATIGWAGEVIDPGEYEIRVRVRNGFNWSAWSNGTVQMYDTKNFVRKSNQWWAVPVWEKKAGTFVLGK